MTDFDDVLGEISKEVDKAGGGIKNKPVNHVVFVMDHSGSMTSITKVAIDSFNEQIQRLKEESYDQDTFVTLIEFNSNFATIFREVDVNKVDEIESYPTGGLTALYDAIALAISHIKEIPQMGDKESNHSALIVSVTDGYENCSREYSLNNSGRKRLKKMISELEKEGNWTFTFMGIDQDPLETAVGDLGFSVGNVFASASSDVGTFTGSRDFTETMTKGVTTYMSARRNGHTNVKNYYSDDGSPGGETENASN